MRPRLIWLLVAAGLLLAGTVDAGVSFIRERTTTAYVGPGDIVTFYTWVGVRAYSLASANSQVNAVALTRTSDTHTCNIKVQTTGALATTTSGCSNSGENGTPIGTWCNATTCNWQFLDQAGHGGTYSTGGTAPTALASCIGSSYCMSASAGYNISTSFALHTPTALSGSFVMQDNNTSVTYAYDTFSCGGGGGPTQKWGNAVTTAQAGVTPSGFDATASTSHFHAINTVYNGASSVTNVDGTETTGTTGTLGEYDSVTIASSRGGGCGGNANMYFAEGGVAELNETSGNRTALCRNEQAFYGTSNFPATC